MVYCLVYCLETVGRLVGVMNEMLDFNSHEDFTRPCVSTDIRHFRRIASQPDNMCVFGYVKLFHGCLDGFLRLVSVRVLATVD